MIKILTLWYIFLNYFLEFPKLLFPNKKQKNWGRHAKNVTFSLFCVYESPDFVTVGIFQKLTDKGSKFKVTSISEVSPDPYLFMQKEMTRVWKLLDSNLDGQIDLKEFEKFMLSKVIVSRLNKLKYWQIKSIFDYIDEDKSGLIDFNEFCKLITKNDAGELVLRIPINKPYKELNAAWNNIDKDGRGVINFEDFYKFIEMDYNQWRSVGEDPISKERSMVVFRRMDMDGNAVVDFDEFCRFLKQGKDGKFRLFIDEI